MKTKSILVSVAAILAIPAAIALGQTSDAYSVQVTGTFDYPGTGIQTRPQKINDQGDIVGVFVDSSGASHAFVLRRSGTFSPPLTDPNDTGALTEGRGINNDRLVCGDYLDGSTGNYHGFFLQGKTFTDYDVPNSTWTIVLGLNNAGDFCGSAIVDSVQQAFLSIGGTVTTFSVPGASNTLDYQINDNNQSCGYYIDASAIDHGLYVDADGTVHAPIDPVGSTGTVLFGNNKRDIIVGRYVDSVGITHGLVFFPPSRFLVFDYPGSSFTSLNGINKHNQIVGRYTDNSGFDHGITAELVKGSGGNSVELPLAAPREPAPYRAPQQAVQAGAAY